MKLSHILSRTQSNESLVSRKHTPWISSPLDKKAGATSSEGGGTPEESKLNVNERVLQFGDGPVHHHEADIPIFKTHHESSTIELFYDLFFVANLSTFTANHEVVNGATLSSYTGFFTLMWFTWLETSLFDVRFSSDSVFNRVCKAISFGVMTGFAIVGVLYDTDKLDVTLDGEDSLQYDRNAFQAMAIILMVSRLALLVQYGMVAWYVRGFKRTFTPLASTMGVLFIAAMIFLGTCFAFPVGHNTHTYAGWYTVVVLEAVAIIAISCYWRVVSFKHTYLVERVGLLTLIIMGEGIIGMTKSVATILQNSVGVSSRIIGTVIAAVLLIYFIWVLYFDQIEHDRFGTIRQQIWAVLHFPLHLAILFTVEGSTQFIIWDNIVENWNWIDNNLWWPDSGFNSTASYVDSLQMNLTTFDNRFKRLELLDDYDYTKNLTTISGLKNITTFNTEGWNTTNDILNDLYDGLLAFVFYNFNIEIPEAELSKAKTGDDRIAALQGVFITVFYYFFIAAGGLLITLGVMYWFGKSHKSRWELLSIVVRVLSGIALALVSLSSLQEFFKLFYSPWLIPLVVIVYLIVISIDNVLVWHSNKTIAHAIQYGRAQSLQGSA